MMSRHMLAACLIRLVFLIYGEYQDRVMRVPYTDVDYHVFTDAAQLLAQGQSPYRRATYRYTPLLAWLLLPTTTCRWFGKLVFSALDVAAGSLVWRLVAGASWDRATAACCAALWWYNPLPVTVCSRGNAESLVVCLVLYLLYLLQRRAVLLAGLCLGLAVHVKLYPVVFAPALYWSLAGGQGRGLWKWVVPNGPRLQLVFGAAVGFLTPTLVSWHFYGYEFLQETYLYHLTRRDVRHNFSLFFYLLYLTNDFPHWWQALVTFLPQLLLTTALAVRFHNPRHLPFCLLCQTYVFVTFNKVCTSQYFLWYLSLLPPVMPSLRGSWLEGAGLLALWYFAQASWLLPAYFLEFDGRNTFMFVWAESVAFFCANVGILARLIRKYDPSDPTDPRPSPADPDPTGLKISKLSTAQ